jgi:hypothetical protein
MSTEEINVNRDWNVDVNLSGLNAPTGAKNMEVPEGFFKAKITDMYVNPERNPNRVVIKMQISEGPFAGTIRTDGLNIPKSDEDKVRYYWRGLAESSGYTPAQLDNGSIQLGRGTFIDRIVHIHFTPKAVTGDYEQIDYLPPSEWSQQRQVFDATNRTDIAGATGAAGSVLGAAGGSGSGGGGDTTTKSDVLSKLGIGQPSA